MASCSRSPPTCRRALPRASSPSPGHIPPPGSLVTAGFLFDVPVRFDIDAIEVDLSAFEAGEIPRIPVVEIIA